MAPATGFMQDIQESFLPYHPCSQLHQIPCYFFHFVSMKIQFRMSDITVKATWIPYHPKCLPGGILSAFFFFSKKVAVIYFIKDHLFYFALCLRHHPTQYSAIGYRIFKLTQSVYPFKQRKLSDNFLRLKNPPNSIWYNIQFKILTSL